MDYNVELQNCNINLQNILAQVEDLGKGDKIETWFLTKENGTTLNIQVNTPTMYTITLDLDPLGVTSSNTNTLIKHGTTYRTTLSSGTSTDYTHFDEVLVYMENLEIEDDDFGQGGYLFNFYPNESQPWLVDIVIPNVVGDIYVKAKLSIVGNDEGEEY